MRAADHPYFDLTGPVGLAHRGGAAYTPNHLRENTIAAFAQAVSLGYRYLETDVHATRDGHLVAFHDDRLDRVTDQTGAIAQTPYAQVSRARTRAGDPIPTLAQVLEEFPQARINIDVKAAGAIAPLVELIRATNAWDRVCVGSFSERRLWATRRALGRRLATAAGPAGVVGWRFGPAMVERWVHSPAPVLQIPVDYLVRGRRVRLVTSALVERVHRAGKHVHVWTIDDPDQMRELLDLGANGIVSDRIDLLREVLAERGRIP